MPLARRPPGDPPHLSLAQLRLWLFDQMSPLSSAYNASVAMRIDGPLDRGALRRALDEVVRRHEVLRTVVALSPTGLPEAVLLEGARAGWEEADLSGARDELEGRLRSAAEKPFDLAADVMLRASLSCLGPEEHVLMLVTHHIASDGWSRGVLFSELATLYRAARREEEHGLPELAVQYGDFALWQERYFDGPRLEAEAAFWREQLTGADVVLELPVDRPRPARPSYRGKRVGFEVGGSPADGLRAVGRQEQATLFMVLMAVTGSLLFALTSQDDVVLGSPVANRLRPEVEGLIGFFVNTVVFRVRMYGDPTFRELVRRCRGTAVECLSHQELPFDKVVELLRPKRKPGLNPLFQVNYRLQGPPPPPPQLDGARTARLETDFGASRFDLGIGFVDAPGPLRGYLEYSVDLFSDATVAGWAAATASMLTHVASRPDARLSELADLARAAMAGHSGQA